MAVESHDARLRFLHEATAALVASPTVSSWLQHERNLTVHEDDKSTSPSFACTGCSQTMLPGYSCEMQKAPRTRKDRLDGMPVAKSCRCNACGTINALPTKKLRSAAQPVGQARPRSSAQVYALSSQPKVLQRLASVEPSLLQSEAKSSSSRAVPPLTQPPSSNKKRGRGKNASLQALLANKKPEPPKKAGFDFIDFLKS